MRIIMACYLPTCVPESQCFRFLEQLFSSERRARWQWWLVYPFRVGSINERSPALRGSAPHFRAQSINYWLVYLLCNGIWYDTIFQQSRGVQHELPNATRFEIRLIPPQMSLTIASSDRHLNPNLWLDPD